MTWRVAQSLLTLREQVNKKYPIRSKDSDGTIGDAAHASRSSDHNPWVKDGVTGVVTAMDITHDPKGGFDSYAFAEMLRQKRDPRIKYVISNRRIWSSEQSPFEWRAYHGSNPHDHHVHISVKSDKAHYDDTHPWDLGDLPETQHSPVSPTPVTRSTIRIGAANNSVQDVMYLQRMLGLTPSGVFDGPTEDAVREFQKRYGLFPDGIVGRYTWRQLEA